MLRMDLDDARFEVALSADVNTGAPTHAGPWRVYPHDDADALAEDILEVAAFRLSAATMLP